MDIRYVNELQGHIEWIETSGNLRLVKVALEGGQFLKAIVIDTPQDASYLNTEAAVAVVFKETEVIIGLNAQSQISLQNQLPATVVTLERGKLLAKLALRSAAGNFSSIISAAAVEQLGLEVGREVIAMINLNEVMLRAL